MPGLPSPLPLAAKAGPSPPQRELVVTRWRRRSVHSTHFRHDIARLGWARSFVAPFRPAHVETRQYPQRVWLRPPETPTNDPFRHSLSPTSNLGLFCHLPGRRPPGLFEGPEDDSLEEASWDDPEDTSPEA